MSFPVPTVGIFGQLAAALAGSAPQGLEAFFSRADIDSVMRFRAGGPLPVTPGALELLSLDIELDHRV